MTAIVYQLPVRTEPAEPSPEELARGALLRAYLEEACARRGLPSEEAAFTMTDAGVAAVLEASGR